MWKRGKKALALIPLDDIFSDECTTSKKTQLLSRVAADFKGWKNDNAKFEAEFEKVVKALRSDEGARAKPPKPKL